MLARLSKGLDEAELTRAHFITVFFWLGFESGHRQRGYAASSMTSPNAVQNLLETMHAHHVINGPFFAGWCMGWKFEPFIATPVCREPGCDAAPIDESDFCGEHQG